MWSSTEVSKTSLLIKANGSILKIFQKFQLILIPFFGKIIDCLLLGYILSEILIFFPGEFQHFRFYFLQLVGAKFTITEVNIIVKPGINSWTYAKFNSWEEGFQCFSHKVCGTVPKSRFAQIIVPR